MLTQSFLRSPIRLLVCLFRFCFITEFTPFYLWRLLKLKFSWSPVIFESANMSVTLIGNLFINSNTNYLAAIFNTYKTFDKLKAISSSLTEMHGCQQNTFYRGEGSSLCFVNVLNITGCRNSHFTHLPETAS